jgi:hypothetical protein
MRKRIVIWLVAALVPTFAFSDGTLVSWGPQSIAGMTQERWNAAKALDTAAILQRVRAASSWAECYEALLGLKNRKDDHDLLRRIVAEVSSATSGKISGTDGLIIWQRIRSGDILFVGKGLWVEDDLFRTAGRANWLLRVVLQKNFGPVTPSSTSQELKELQSKWESYLAGKSLEEYESQYQTTVKSYQAIRSLPALQALVVSLQPSAEKDAYTKQCLKNIYGLDALPSESGNPARLCNPDQWTNLYLAALTGITESHNSSWWAAWWSENQELLRWDPGTGQFLARPRPGP